VSYRNICFELKTGTEELMPPIPDSLADRAAALLKCGRNRARDAKKELLKTITIFKKNIDQPVPNVKICTG
jgi:hypothetical protein